MRITYLLRLIHCLIILHQNERFGLTSDRPKLGDRQGLVTDMYKYIIVINRQRILLKYHRYMKDGIWDGLLIHGFFLDFL